jgi:hypothetical protein
MASVYALGIVGGSLAAMAASYIGSNLTGTTLSAPELTPSKKEPETEEPVQETIEEPEPEEPSSAVAPSLPEIESMAGGGFGRPSWAPLNPQATPTINTLVSKVEVLPNNTTDLQKELTQVTHDLEDLNYQVFQLESKRKPLEDEFKKIRTSYRAALVKQSTSKAQISIINQQLEGAKNPKKDEKGLSKKFIQNSDKYKKTDDEKNNKDGKNHKSWLERIKGLLEKDDSIDKESKPAQGQSMDDWWSKLPNEGTSAKFDINKLIADLSAQEQTLFEAEDIISDEKEKFESLNAEITQIRSELLESKLKSKSLENRRILLISALTKQTGLVDSKTELLPLTTAEIQEKLVNYNTKLLELADAERTLKEFYMKKFNTEASRLTIAGKTKRDFGDNSDGKKLFEYKEEVDKKREDLEMLKLELAGKSKVTISPLTELINNLRFNNIQGIEAIDNNTFKTVFNTYSEIANSNPSTILTKLDEYHKFFGTKSDYVMGYNGQTISRGFLYVVELRKRNQDVKDSLDKFIKENVDLAYKAFVNLGSVKEIIDSRRDPNGELPNTSDSVRALLEGRSVNYSKLVNGFKNLKKGAVALFNTSDQKKIESLVKNFEERIINKLNKVSLRSENYYVGMTGPPPPVPTPLEDIPERPADPLQLLNEARKRLIIPAPPAPAPPAPPAPAPAPPAPAPPAPAPPTPAPPAPAPASPPAQRVLTDAKMAELGGNRHSTRRHSLRFKPSRSITHKTY